MINLGILDNLREYRKFEPPDYDLKKVSAPIMLFYAINDRLSFEKVITIVVVIIVN